MFSIYLYQLKIVKDQIHPFPPPHYRQDMSLIYINNLYPVSTIYFR